MEDVETNTLPSLNVEYIQKKLVERYVYTEKAKDCDLVLVIGNEGAGKSTACNYLLGHQMKEKEFNGRDVVETVCETDIKIGHEVKSETLYAKTILVRDATSVHSEANNNICLVDCPGFEGNGTVEDRVIQSISIELAIRNAKQVKGILILISINDLLEARVIAPRKLVKTLISLFKDPVEMVQYSIIIITKKYKLMPDSKARKSTIGALESLKDHCEEKARFLNANRNLSSSEGLTYKDYDKIATYFSAVLDRRDDIVFINPLDNGESRQLIFDRINGIKPRTGYFKAFAKAGFEFAKKTINKIAGTDTNKCPLNPITIDDINCSEFDENRINFNKSVYDCSHNGSILIKKCNNEFEKCVKIHSEISNTEARLLTQKQLFHNLSEEVSKIKVNKSQNFKIDFQSIRNLESMIVDNDKDIKVAQSEHDQNDIFKKKLVEELKIVNTTSPIIFMQKSICKNVGWWKIFGWEEMNLKANTGDSSIPIIAVDKSEPKNGSWTDEIDERNVGRYRISYLSDYYARPAKASVTTYIQTKDEAGNKIRIEEINNEIAELKKKQEEIESQVEDIKSKNKTLEATIQQAKSSKENYMKSLKQKLKECEKEIERHNNEIPKLQKEMKESKISGSMYLQEFYESQQKFDIIVSISKLLEFPSSIVKTFVSEYIIFLTKIERYISAFEENSVNLDSLSLGKEKDEVVRLKDPITGGNIKDLVVTSAGTLFDMNSLLQQFDITKESILPFLFKQEDGSVEEIKYLAWTAIPDIQSYMDNQRNEKACSGGLSAPTSFLTKLEIDKMTADELDIQKDELLQEINVIEEQLVAKRTELEQIFRRLGVRQGVNVAESESHVA